jgi:hypothetical protein
VWSAAIFTIVSILRYQLTSERTIKRQGWLCLNTGGADALRSARGFFRKFRHPLRCNGRRVDGGLDKHVCDNERYGTRVELANTAQVDHGPDTDLRGHDNGVQAMLRPKPMQLHDRWHKLYMSRGLEQKQTQSKRTMLFRFKGRMLLPG